MTLKRRIGALLPAMALAGLLAFSPGLCAQETASAAPSGAGASSASGTSVAAANALPDPFRAPRENFFRRFEIIAFGSLPITLLYTNISFQVYHFIENDFDMNWAPWPFEGSSTDSITDSERFLRIGVAAGVAVAIAGVDALIRYLQVRKAERLAAARAGLPEAGGASMAIGEAAGAAE